MATDSMATQDPSIATAQGAVLFQLIGQRPNDPRYAEVMQENTEILMGMGGLIYGYMKRVHPVIDAPVMDIKTWTRVIENLPDLVIGQPVQKSYTNRLGGNQVANNFLSLLANAVIIEGGSLPTNFASYLSSVGDAIFKAISDQQSYNVMTCTYQNYLVDNGMGGYYDYSAIVLREVNFRDYFQQLKSSCGSDTTVNIDLNYTEIRSLIQTRRLRPGGPDYANFQQLLNPNDTAEFSRAANVFNAGATPQSQIRPMV